MPPGGPYISAFRVWPNIKGHVGVIEPAGNLYRRAVVAWVRAVQRRAVVVVLLSLVVTGAALFYTARTLTINTDTVDMISTDVPFRRHSEAFDRAFPQFRDRIVIVIHAISPERSEAAAAALVKEIEHRPNLFRHAQWLGGDRFFTRNGLLYLSVEKLSALADELAAAEPLIAALAADPTLRGVFDVLAQGLEAANTGEAGVGRLDVVLTRVAEVVEAQLAGRPRNLSWRELFARGGAGAANRQFIIVQPVLDYATLSPGAAAPGWTWGSTGRTGPGRRATSPWSPTASSAR